MQSQEPFDTGWHLPVQEKLENSIFLRCMERVASQVNTIRGGKRGFLQEIIVIRAHSRRLGCTTFSGAHCVRIDRVAIGQHYGFSPCGVALARQIDVGIHNLSWRCGAAE